MKIFRLIRVATGIEATFGVLLDDKIPFCVTLELPWINNERHISCIPLGTYTCSIITSPKFGRTFEVKEVPGRFNILFHKGNIKDDTHGCILLGERYDPLDSENAILSSTMAFREFMTRLANEHSFRLEIRKNGI